MTTRQFETRLQPDWCRRSPRVSLKRNRDCVPSWRADQRISGTGHVLVSRL